MKQFKWVIILAAAAAILTVVFIFVDKHTQKEKEREAIGGPQQLISFEPSQTDRISVDNEDGHFEFKWNPDEAEWQLTAGDKFNVNSYAIAAICNYLCNLKSLKTVSSDCADTSIYGFDHPVTLKAYTTDTGEDHPYTLYVGDHTPTNNAFYAMIEGSNDVFTISYEAGSIFCVAKDTLKNMYLFDTFSNLVTYYKQTRDGELVAEMTRAEDYSWNLNAPGTYSVQKANIDNMMDILVRVTVESYVAEHPADLKQYGLDNPHDILVLKGKKNTSTMEEEIWFGGDASDTEIYGYFKNSEQVFRVKKANVSFLNTKLSSYVYPYCAEIAAADLSAIEADLSAAADLHFKLDVDTENAQYSLDGKDITALHNDKANTLFQNLLRSLIMLQFTDTAPYAKPDPEAEAAMFIKFTYKDGHERTLRFIEFETNNYYVMDDSKYTGLTIRMNRFEGTGSIPYNYQELMNALK